MSENVNEDKQKLVDERKKILRKAYGFASVTSEGNQSDTLARQVRNFIAKFQSCLQIETGDKSVKLELILKFGDDENTVLVDLNEFIPKT